MMLRIPVKRWRCNYLLTRPSPLTTRNSHTFKLCIFLTCNLGNARHWVTHNDTGVVCSIGPGCGFGYVPVALAGLPRATPMRDAVGGKAQAAKHTYTDHAHKGDLPICQASFKAVFAIIFLVASGASAAFIASSLQVPARSLGTAAILAEGLAARRAAWWLKAVVRLGSIWASRVGVISTWRLAATTTFSNSLGWGRNCRKSHEHSNESDTK